MSYTEAKEFAMLRLELRAACQRGDRAAAGAALARFTQMAQGTGNDNELAAEIRRWMIKLDAS